jgi:pimeloyl-ACP methyl ester carboxylesterase
MNEGQTDQQTARTPAGRNGASIQPFRIDVAPEVLSDLRQRLKNTRWSYQLEGTNWEAGTDLNYLKEFVAYWHDTYDWRKHEATLNQFAHFKADIGWLNVHFVEAKGQGPAPMPLLLLHGWPDSFYRFYKVIPILSDPARHGGDLSDAFDLVVPSLPGFGFSGPARRPSPEQPLRQDAQVLWRLMTEVLGYDHFAVAGGDGGSPLAQLLAIEHPESVIGIHLTDLGWQAGNVDPSTLTKPEQKYLDGGKKSFMGDGAYAMLQATKPQSLAPALNDSPVGLASWILDRFHSWSDSGGDIERSFSKDELLTNIMLYWVTQTIAASMANYRDNTCSPSLKTTDYVRVPVGMALFPKEPGGVPPRVFAERTLNVKRWTEMPRGSHFAALEEPALFAGDVTEFFRGLRT